MGDGNISSLHVSVFLFYNEHLLLIKLGKLIKWNKEKKAHRP